MPKNVLNIQRIINNDILKIVNIVFSGGGGAVAPLIANLNLKGVHFFIHPVCRELYRL